MLSKENFIVLSFLYSLILNLYFLFQCIKKDNELKLYRYFFEHLEEISKMTNEEFKEFIENNKIE